MKMAEAILDALLAEAQEHYMYGQHIFRAHEAVFRADVAAYQHVHMQAHQNFGGLGATMEYYHPAVAQQGLRTFDIGGKC